MVLVFKGKIESFDARERVDRHFMCTCVCVHVKNIDGKYKEREVV